MISFCLYLAIGLVIVDRAYVRRIAWIRSRCVRIRVIVAVALLWPLLVAIEAAGKFSRWREERQRQREWDDPTLVSGEPTDDEPTLPCAPPEPADWDNVIELRGRR